MKPDKPTKIVEYKGFSDENGKDVIISENVTKLKLSDKLSAKAIQDLLIKKCIKP